MRYIEKSKCNHFNKNFKSISSVNPIFVFIIMCLFYFIIQSIYFSKNSKNAMLFSIKINYNCNKYTVNIINLLVYIFADLTLVYQTLNY